DGPGRRGLLSANGKNLSEINEISVRPEEPPSLGGVSKGVLARKSTVSPKMGRLPPSACVDRLHGGDAAHRLRAAGPTCRVGSPATPGGGQGLCAALR